MSCPSSAGSVPEAAEIHAVEEEEIRIERGEKYIEKITLLGKP
jgi:hypothetical protein